ncbi:hypothetical protein [Longicatena caecimuris]|uniref:hypothetical protein n=1 Tax=Longicatena caecimuris TaxID=1796635 RepID=UPI001E2D6E32|nr:hypothetical protein [Longicatena caecimuris]
MANIKITLDTKQLYPAVINLKQFSNNTDVLTFEMENYMYETTDLSKLDAYAICDMVNQEVDEVKLEKQVVENKLRLTWTVTGYTTQLDGHITYQIVFKDIANEKATLWFSHQGIIFISESHDGDGHIVAKYPTILQQWEQRMGEVDEHASNAIDLAGDSAIQAQKSANEAEQSAINAANQASDATDSATKSEQMKDYIEQLINYEGTNAIEKEVVEARGGKLTLGTRLDDVDKLLEEKSNSNHTHDDRYYIKTELNNKLNAKLDTTGDASNVTNEFTQAASRTNLTTGEKLAISLGKIMKFFADLKDIAFSGSFNDLADIPASFPPSSHNHDDRYYTETEMNTKLDLKINTSDIVTVDSTSNTKVPSAGYVKTKFNNINNKLTSNLNQNRIELTNSSYYPTTICYRSGQAVSMKCAGTLEKEVPANSPYVIGLESMMPEEFRPNADITAYPNISFAGKNIKVEIKTTGRVIFTTNEKLPIGFGLNMHFTYMTGKSNF